MIRVSVKNPFIDDFEDECTNSNCGENGHAHRVLAARSRREARKSEG